MDLHPLFSLPSFREVIDFESIGITMTPLKSPTMEQPWQMALFHFSSNSRLGMHPATTPQLFLILEGTGWVRIGDQDPRTIQTGELLHFIPGELHETETGMKALIIEGENLEIHSYLLSRNINKRT